MDGMHLDLNQIWLVFVPHALRREAPAQLLVSAGQALSRSVELVVILSSTESLPQCE